MTTYSKFALCALVMGVFTLTSCSNDNDGPAPESIYQRLGGTTLVDDPDSSDPSVTIEAGRLAYRKVVVSTVGNIVADIQPTFVPGNLGTHFSTLLGEVNTGNNTNLAELVDNLTDFFSFNSGGTNAVNVYTGLSMENAHNPSVNPRMGATSTDANFTKFKGYVGAAAVTNGVAANTQLYVDIVALLESQRAPIVQ